MLVLARKEGEGVKIGDGVVVTVQSAHRGRVLLQVSAPNEIKIERLNYLGEVEKRNANKRD